MKIKDQIMFFHDGTRSTREIADLVYGAPATHAQVAHVRVVIRQRKGGGQSGHDKKYQDSLYSRGDVDIARASARTAYSRARKKGLATPAAATEARRKYRDAMMMTGMLSRDGERARA